MSDLISKIGSLLSKAESTTNEHERDAYLAKAQQLATVASIDLEVARQKQKDKTKRESPTVRRIELFDWNDRSRTKAFFVGLMVAIGHNNDLRFTVAHDSTYINAYGYPSDIDVTEALYNSLSVQMVKGADAYLKTGEYKKEIVEYDDPNGWSWTEKPMDGRTARRSFYTAFTQAIHERLKEARDKVSDVTVTHDDGTEESGALVLVRKSDSVSDYFDEHNDARGSYRGNGYEGRGRSSKAAGNKAGSSASLGGGGMVGSRAGSIGR
jgi:hypothetical protein